MLVNLILTGGTSIADNLQGFLHIHSLTITSTTDIDINDDYDNNDHEYNRIYSW